MTTPNRSDTPSDCLTLLARYHTERWEKGNYAVIDELFHPEYRGAGLEQGAPDVPAAIKTMLSSFLATATIAIARPYNETANRLCG